MLVIEAYILNKRLNYVKSGVLAMNELESQDVQCPYCGEYFELLVDGSVPRQEYVEDCEVCCRPIVFLVTVVGEGVVEVMARQEDD